MPVITAGSSEEEMEKRLGSAVLAGRSLITIDNVVDELGGAAICQLISEHRPGIRILGPHRAGGGRGARHVDVRQR